MNEFLKEYLAGLKLERNLSDNTLSAYENDISSLLQFLKFKNITDLSEVTFQHINLFYKELNKLGLSAKSIAR